MKNWRNMTVKWTRVVTDIIEGKLRLQFAEDWQAIKFDSTNWHRHQMKSQLKAMDVLATLNDQHWWIEIKNCEGFETANLPRLSPIDSAEVLKVKAFVKKNGLKRHVRITRKKLFIVDEVVKKMRDTLLSLTFARRFEEPELLAFSQWCGSDKPLMIVLLLRWEIVDFKRFARLLQHKLNVALAPYHLQGFVINESARIIGLDCTISPLPHRF